MTFRVEKGYGGHRVINEDTGMVEQQGLTEETAKDLAERLNKLEQDSPATEKAKEAAEAQVEHDEVVAKALKEAEEKAEKAAAKEAKEEEQETPKSVSTTTTRATTPKKP